MYNMISSGRVDLRGSKGLGNRTYKIYMTWSRASISGLSLPGFSPVRCAFTQQKHTWVNSTQVEPGLPWGAFFVV